MLTATGTGANEACLLALEPPRQGARREQRLLRARASSTRPARTGSTSPSSRAARIGRSIPTRSPPRSTRDPVDQVGVLRQPRDARRAAQPVRGDRPGLQAARADGRRGRDLERVRVPDRHRGLADRPRHRVVGEGDHGGARPRHRVHERGVGRRARRRRQAARLLPRRDRRVQEAARRAAAAVRPAGRAPRGAARGVPPPLRAGASRRTWRASSARCSP